MEGVNPDPAPNAPRPSPPGGSCPQGKWVVFRDHGESPSGKTKRWLVTPKTGGADIGTVAWWAPWRKYCFFPADNTVFEQDCLRDIATFIEERTKEHKA